LAGRINVNHSPRQHKKTERTEGRVQVRRYNKPTGGFTDWVVAEKKGFKEDV